jgi:hypothetical protein
MTTTTLKKAIIKKLDRTQDADMLEIINKLLDKASLDTTLKHKLTKRALKSEADIRTQHVYSKTEALKKIRL